MRFFISALDLTGTRRTTRLNIHHCTSTTPLIRQICQELGVNRKSIIIKMKAQPQNLVLIQNWDIHHYNIRNGTTFLIQIIQQNQKEFNQPLHSIVQEQLFQEEAASESSKSDGGRGRPSRVERQNIEVRYSRDFEDSLNSLLDRVRMGNLSEIAEIMKAEPLVEDEQELRQVLERKNRYILNQLGDCGRNALHWAIHMNNLELVSFLLIKGSHPDLLTIDHYTPLQLAVLHHASDILQMLLNHHKIDVNQLTPHGTAIHLAVRNQDIKCLQILLRHDASFEIADSQGKIPLQICKNQQVASIINRKVEMGKLIIPCIAKGPVFRAVGTTKRLKERVLVVNPFKDDLSICEVSGQLQERWPLSCVFEVEEIEEKSWLMKNNMSYFKITLSEKQKTVLLAVEHSNICNRWLHHFRLSLKYLQYSIYQRPVAAGDQAVEYLDDAKGQAVLHKRKVQEKSSNKSKNSIMNLKLQSQIEQQKTPSSRKTLKNTDETQSNRSNEEDRLKESEIVLGSVIQINRLSSKSKHTTSFEGSISPFCSEENISVTPFQTSENGSQNRFRKGSQPKIQTVSEFALKDAKKISYVDFEMLKLLGNGAFGKVYLAKYRQNGSCYALKVLNKKKLFAKKQLKYAVGETNILKKMDCPFIVKLYFAFQTPKNLYMALDHCPLGDLAMLVATKQQLQQTTARFVIAQLVLAIEYLHRQGILYRDLKPQNILIDSDGYIKLTDFGLSRQNSFASSFCGSPAYLSPQMLQKKGVGISSDIYGIGCVLYQMVVGEPPYFNEDMDVLFDNIKQGKLRFPSNLSLQIRSLLSRLLERDLTKRLGVKHMGEIKHHDFFKKIDWKKLQQKRVQVPHQMFANQDEQLMEGISLQVRQNIKLNDNDYNQTTGMINRVKNFTFVREGTSDPEVVPASLLTRMTP